MYIPSKRGIYPQGNKSSPEGFQQEAVQKLIMQILGKKVWHVKVVPSIFVSVHKRNSCVNRSRFNLRVSCR